MTTQSPLVWADDGQPRSRLYGDVYFSTQDGLAESRAVFLAGCGLPQAWSGRRRFTVAELGFGAGLNILALLDLWRATAPTDAHLHIFSVEAHPLSAQEAARALAAWPELAEIADVLIATWPGQARGFHRVDLPAFNATLDLAVMEAEPALRAWGGEADAWFLDGFSPALNPDMWRDDLLALVAERSAPDARAATFTVAGAVRRGLQAAGFSIEKRPGHGRKRERLEARLSGPPRVEAPPPRVAVIGAGIAGVNAARALRALGCAPLLIAGGGPAASGNPAALVTPRLDSGLGPVARLAAQAFNRAVSLYGADSVIARGVLQLATGERDPERFERIAACDLFEPGALTPIDAAQASARLGDAVPAALDLRTALVVEPAAVLAGWSGPVLAAEVARLERRDGVWTMLDATGAVIVQVEAVILAAGQAGSQLRPDLPLKPVRGQASWTQGGETAPAVAWGGYVLPTRSGVLFGATHDRDETAVDVRAADHDRNRATLAEALPNLAAALAQAPLEGRAGVRATTPDHLPLAGPVAGAAGLFALTGFGSRGFCLAPLLAEHVAALVLDAPSPLPTDLAALVDPDRFRARAARRGRNSVPNGS